MTAQANKEGFATKSEFSLLIGTSGPLQEKLNLRPR